MVTNKKMVFPTLLRKDTFGRKQLLDELYKIAEGSANKATSNIFLSGRRKTGKTEILKVLYNRLFYNQDEVIPFYYSFPEEICSIYDFCKDFLFEFFRQYIGFTTKDPSLILIRPSPQQLRKHIEETYYNLSSSINKLYDLIEDNDPVGALVTAFSLPAFISSETAQTIFIAIDDFQNIQLLNPLEKRTIYKEFEKSLHNSHHIHLFSGYSSNNIISSSGTTFYDLLITKKLDPLSQKESEEMWNSLSHHTEETALVKNDTQHIVKKLAHTPFYLKILSRSSINTGIRCNTLDEFYSLYFDELTSGSIFMFFTSILNNLPHSLRKPAILFLKKCGAKRYADLEQLKSDIPCSFEDLEVILHQLGIKGIIEHDITHITLPDDPVLSDYIDLLFQMRAQGKTKESLKGIWIWEQLKIVEKEKTIYKHAALLRQCQEIVQQFSCQQIPKILLNHRKIRKTDEQKKTIDYRELLSEPGDYFRLPVTVGTSWEDAPELVGALNILIVYCFKMSTDKPVIWIVGCMGLGQKATAEQVMLFLKRASFLKEKFKSQSIKKWIISNNGFNEESLRVIDSAAIFSSDLNQLSLMKEKIMGAKKKSTEHSDYEFELTLPAANETELIAARATEEIAKKGNFNEHAIKQVKMAIIEACINAFEHSETKDGIIHIKFCLQKDKLTILVDHEGIGFDPAFIAEPHIDDKIRGLNKRGWGIKIMENLMDEVSFDQEENYTRLKMVKYI